MQNRQELWEQPWVVCRYPTTFTPLKIGSVTLKNRLVQGPVSVPTVDLTDNLTPDGAAFLIERAKGGFGLVIQTACWADMEVEGLGPGFMMTPLRNPAVFMSRCGVLTEKIHSYGGKIFCQVTMGMGRNVPGLKAASSVPDFFMPDQMHEVLTVEEIQKKIQYMAQTAAMLKNAGYDGVEVHAMHWGYLIDQFAMTLTNHHHDHRHLFDIQEIVEKLDLPYCVKNQVREVYYIIAEAEAKVHGEPMEHIHFHELGTMDAVADISAACRMIDLLQPDRIVATPICTGFGSIRCAHGILPVPAPATAVILEGVPSFAGEIEGELSTPTGTALIRHFAQDSSRQPPMVVQRRGYGIGKKDFGRLSAVRASIGEAV